MKDVVVGGEVAIVRAKIPMARLKLPERQGRELSSKASGRAG